MLKLPRHKAAALADRLYEELRPRFLERVIELLAEPGPRGLPPEGVHRRAGGRAGVDDADEV